MRPATARQAGPKRPCPPDRAAARVRGLQARATRSLCQDPRGRRPKLHGGFRPQPESLRGPTHNLFIRPPASSTCATRAAAGRNRLLADGQRVVGPRAPSAPAPPNPAAERPRNTLRRPGVHTAERKSQVPPPPVPGPLRSRPESPARATIPPWERRRLHRAVPLGARTSPSAIPTRAPCPQRSIYPMRPISSIRPLPTAHCPLPTVHCPLSTVHCSPSTAHRPLLTVHCPLPTVPCPLSTPPRPKGSTVGHPRFSCGLSLRLCAETCDKARPWE